MKPLLEVRDLVTAIGGVRVVDGVAFRVAAGETYALLGESGCGKSITALSLMRLLPDGGRVISGSVQLGETDVLALPERDMRRVRGGQMAMIFQEPMLALNPVIKVGEQIGEALALHQNLAGQAARDAARGLLDAVGVGRAGRRGRPPPLSHFRARRALSRWGGPRRWVSPSRMPPDTIRPPSGNSRISDRAVIDLPQPDSPSKA